MYTQYENSDPQPERRQKVSYAGAGEAKPADLSPMAPMTQEPQSPSADPNGLFKALSQRIMQPIATPTWGMPGGAGGGIMGSQGDPFVMDRIYRENPLPPPNFPQPGDPPYKPYGGEMMSGGLQSAPLQGPLSPKSGVPDLGSMLGSSGGWGNG